MGTFFRHLGGLIGRLIRDRQANAAIEFAFVVPLMLTMFFGLIVFSGAITVNRKVTLVARTMSDLVSQSSVVSDADLTNFRKTGEAIMTPYGPTPLEATVSELYVDPETNTAKVMWSKGDAAMAKDTPVSIPDVLKIGGTYLIYSQVKYTYRPAVTYLIDKVAGRTLQDETYTRPRLSLCVLLNLQKVCPT